MMKEIELKPCPFCGGKPARVLEHIHDFGMFGHIDMARVECTRCGKSGAMVDDWNNYYERIMKNLTLVELAIEVWNRMVDNEQRESD